MLEIIFVLLLLLFIGVTLLVVTSIFMAYVTQATYTDELDEEWDK